MELQQSYKRIYKRIYQKIVKYTIFGILLYIILLKTPVFKLGNTDLIKMMVFILFIVITLDYTNELF